MTNKHFKAYVRINNPSQKLNAIISKIFISRKAVNISVHHDSGTSLSLLSCFRSAFSFLSFFFSWVMLLLWLETKEMVQVTYIDFFPSGNGSLIETPRLQWSQKTLASSKQQIIR